MTCDFLDCEPAPLIALDEWDEGPTSEHPAALPHPECEVNPYSSRGCELGTRGCDIKHDMSPPLGKWYGYDSPANRLRGEFLFALGEAETKQQQAEAREAVALDVLAAITERFKATVGFQEGDDSALIMAAERLLAERR